MNNYEKQDVRKKYDKELWKKQCQSKHDKELWTTGCQSKLNVTAEANWILADYY